MRGKSFPGARVHLSLAIVTPLAAVALFAAAAGSIQIHPQYKPGDTFYYQIEMHIASTGETTTPIINPEGGTKFSENVDLLVRLDVLSSGPTSNATKPRKDGDDGAVRMRVTYERAHADSQTDASEFDAASPEKEYNRLEGHAFEFVLRANGTISNFQDLDNILPNTADAAPALAWMKMLASGSGLPRNGIAIGKKWTSEKPLDSAPLTGLIWRSESTYLRNEPCRGTAMRAAEGAEQCAVILTQFRIKHHRAAHADETPPDYLHHGLRTAGTVTGSGESLDSISLASGLLVNSTQNSMQRADFEIIDAANGEKIHRSGQVQTETVITRVAPPAAAVGARQ